MAETADKPLNVQIIGHSYIRRLHEYCDKNNILNLRLDRDFCAVNFRGKGGLRLRHIGQTSGGSRHELFHFDVVPDVVFLQVGGNDISAHTNCTQLARDIVSLAKYLVLGVGVRLVYIGQLIRRLPFTVCTGYNEMVVQTNINLEAMTKHVAGVEFWHHRGFWASLAYLGPDGVHLDCTPSHSQPMRKYLRSIRNAVIQAPKFLRPV
ncbi:hypothetical protein FSP39_018560 [Pinctada imbricata]|uniref:SGNH hydrolase-type esterase domain-containing protein n=1 Tax=Pinctada imbricata TaxID=66713 RepID=A0AA88YJF1_PINIB|nr:hypothetical protein FSP39_018560 [Pinctada imbricata]